MTVTEVAHLPLQKGKSPGDGNTPTGKTLKDAADTLTSQKGFERIYWGTAVENPEALYLFIDWDSVESHKQFAASPAYGAFGQGLTTVLSGKPFYYHVPFTPDPSVALSDTNVGATEILSAFFPTTISESEQEAFTDGLKNLMAAIEENADGFKGAASGWAIEDVPIPESDETGKLFQAVLGWESVEKHILFREHQAFKDNIHHLRNAKDLKKMTVFHSSLKEIQGAGGV